MVLVGATPNNELLFPNSAVFNDVPSFEGGGSYEVIWKVGSSCPPSNVYVILTVVVSIEQNSSKGKALIWFLIKIQDLTLPSGMAE
jgi:hypothetical protein